MAAGDNEVMTAVVVAGDEETRVLLRGLLRLHHFRVVGEADGATQAVDLVKDQSPSVLVTDVNLAEGDITALLDQARQTSPKLRIVLVAPSTRAPPEKEGMRSPDVVLIRPFRIRQFAEALRPSEGPRPPEPPA